MQMRETAMKLEQVIKLAKFYAGTQTKIAEIIGIDKSKLTDWKNGKTKPTPYEIMRMAEIARLEPDLTFYEVMAELDKEHEKFWCARRESNPRPLASETNTLSN